MDLRLGNGRPSIALVTARSVDYAATDDRYLDAILFAHDFKVEWRRWDAEGVDWPRFDLVVLRSCWDYHRRIDEFTQWIAQRAADGTRLVNPPHIVSWNSHKKYLLELSARGVRIPPSLLFRKSGRDSIGDIVGNFGNRGIVIKPAISASSFGTELIASPFAAGAGERLAALQSGCDVLVQPFLEEIKVNGELSLVYFDGVFSHAVRKTPRAGEFRCQASFGGFVERVAPDRDCVDLGARALSIMASRPAYARVDLVQTASGPVLMELELIEPVLFFEHAPAAAERFARVLTSSLSGSRAATAAGA